MSQMKPYCFKCGAELEPEATHCPACGRLQRSMLVRSVDDGGSEPLYGSYAGGEPRPPQPRRSHARALAFAGVGVLGLLVIGFTLGHDCGGGAQPARSTAAAPVVNAVPSQQAVPGESPSAPSPAASPTGQSTGAPGAATFGRVSAEITGGKCSTAQGCPVSGTFKNTGGRGGGTATFSLLDDSGNVVGTYTAPIPVTDPGATAEVSGYATGDPLAAYLKSGGIVHLQVAIQNQ